MKPSSRRDRPHRGDVLDGAVEIGHVEGRAEAAPPSARTRAAASWCDGHSRPLTTT